MQYQLLILNYVIISIQYLNKISTNRTKRGYWYLKLNKITTETYDVRPWTINVLENLGFKREGRLKNHVLIDYKLYDSILHAKFSK